MIEVPLLGQLEPYEFDDWFKSQPVMVKVLGGEYEFVLEAYEEDGAKADFHEAIHNFLNIDAAVLKDAQEHIYQYYQDIHLHLMPDDDWYVAIEHPDEVWKYIELGSPVVSRRPYGDEAIYVSLSCSCQWEQEHGLQIVFKEGLFVNKVGPYDGHLTNSDAYADDSLENVVYR